MEGVCSAQVQAQDKHNREAKGVRCEGEMNKRKLGSFALGIMLFALCLPAEAQQPKKIPRIGYLSPVDPTTESTRAEAIRQALRELGYIEGQNIATEYRYAEGKIDRFPELAAELVRCILRGQNPEGSQACRPAGRAADKV